MKKGWKHVLIAAVAAALSGPVLAEADRPAVRGDAQVPGAPQDVVAADLGTGYNIMTIPAPEFVPRASSVTYDYSGTGYMHIVTNGNVDTDVLWAPVNLPSGAGIGYLDLHARDTNAAEDMSVSLRRFTGFGSRPTCIPFPPFFLCSSVTPSLEDIVSVSSVGSGGAQYVPSSQLSPLHTVNNNIVFGGGGFYTVVVNVPVVGSSLQLRGVDIWWKRQIRPGPASASFTDVPLGAQFFAEVEAMKAAGITGGCTATEYCPDAPVTRRQMAAFFARAMGLYWGQ